MKLTEVKGRKNETMDKKNLHDDDTYTKCSI